MQTGLNSCFNITAVVCDVLPKKTNNISRYSGVQALQNGRMFTCRSEDEKLHFLFCSFLHDDKQTLPKRRKFKFFPDKGSTD